MNYFWIALFSGKSYTLFGHGTEEDGGMMYFATMEIMKRLCDESRTYHIRYVPKVFGGML